MKTLFFSMALLLAASFGAHAQHRGHYYRAVRTVPHGAVVVRYHNYDYHYHNGWYYRPYHARYRYVIPPRGIRVTVLPVGYRTVVWGPTTYYYSTGVFYVRDQDNYVVSNAPAGAVVEDIPDGARKVTIDGKAYFTVNGTYYKQVDNGYQVVGTDKEEMEEDDKGE